MWTEGDESYHQKLMVPALLIYGSKDKLVTLEEELHMKEVSESTVIVIRLRKCKFQCHHCCYYCHYFQNDNCKLTLYLDPFSHDKKVLYGN